MQDADKAIWRRQFDEKHEQHYGTRATDQIVEIVNYRLTAKVVLPKPPAQEYPMQGDNPGAALKGSKQVYFDEWMDCPQYDRERLVSGNRLRGPGIIEQVDSTIVVYPDQEAHVDRFGNLIIEHLDGGEQNANNH